MKKHLLALAGVALVLTSLAACSSGPTGTPSAALTNAATAPVNNRTYTKADLASILKSVNTKLTLGGSVETQDGPQTEAVDALAALLNGGTVTITPPSCTKLLTSDAQIVAKLGSAGVIAGTLSSSKVTVIATAVSGGALPTSLTSKFTASQRATLTSCKNLTIVQTTGGQTNAVTVNYEPIAVTTTASQSVGFKESFTLSGGGGGGASSRTTIEAIDGNLLIFVSGALVQDAPTLEKAVNAVVAAAK